MAAELEPAVSKLGVSENPGQGLGRKRHRRPSVRLGDIGDESKSKSWRLNLYPSPPLGFNTNKTSKTRPLTNSDFKSRRREKMVSNILIDQVAGEERENGEEGFRDSEQEQEQQSPVHSHSHSADNNRRSVRVGGATNSHDFGLAEPESNSRGFQLELNDGVRNWLLGLGLGRYAPVFEIHEVDDEVLPQLTLEDLKDMGINAVGSRRKLYSAILNLHKRFF